LFKKPKPSFSKILKKRDEETLISFFRDAADGSLRASIYFCGTIKRFFKECNTKA
jgi:hypothetical protein